MVIEEYNQRYLNQPYGDQWLLLRDMAYKVHPYRWPTIGLTPDHIRNASMADVQAFYKRYYRPSNAVLAVSGDIEPERVFELAEKWFGELDGGNVAADEIPSEPVQTEARRCEVTRDVPATQITIAFHMGGEAQCRLLYVRCHDRYARRRYVGTTLSQAGQGAPTVLLSEFIHYRRYGSRIVCAYRTAYAWC